MKTYRTGSAALAALLAVIALAAALCGWCALRAKTLVELTFGEETQADAQEEYVSYFSLRAEMVSEQMRTRIRGWQSIAPGEDAVLETKDGALSGVVYPAVQGGEHPAWALVLGGREKVLDMACMLSLSGYRVLMPELTPEGGLDSLGPAEAERVGLWVSYILARDPDAEIVLFGQDTGAAAALIASGEGLDDAVRAIAVDSAYACLRTVARTRLTAAVPDAGELDMKLLELGYRAAFGVTMDEGDIAACAHETDIPVLLIHGTGDEIVPAWHSEDVAAACGGELLLIEGAGHGLSRFVDYKAYEEALLAFYESALR